MTENRIASSLNRNEYPPIIINRIRIFNTLAIINVFVNLLNFFSLAFINSETKVRVIPANSSNKNGQNFVINAGVK